MTEISFTAIELIFAFIWIISRAAVIIKNKKIDWKREALLLLMYINLAVIIRFTFCPMETVNGKVQPLIFDPETAFPFRVNLIPFVNLFDYDNRRDLLLNVIGNAAMFIPSGIVLPVIYRKLNNFIKVVGTGALISLCIEIIQLPFSVRASDVDDLILNTAGVVIGYGIYALVRSIKRKDNKRCVQH
ncbi:MAG: VanZ family protein [Oscillospiraceae bacterium]|nr:VanZ family protein [Oscillospiraceae bacterium]